MRILFHSFFLGDVEDVDIYVAEPITQWQRSEQGQWVMAHAENLRYFWGPDAVRMGYRVDIIGEIEDGPLVTEYLLRWNIKQYW